MKKHILAPAVIALMLVSCTGTSTTENAAESQSVENKDAYNFRDGDPAVWSGVYSGNIPCADCASIDITMVLQPDGSYKTASVHHGKSEEQEVHYGKFEWLADGNSFKAQVGKDQAEYTVYFHKEGLRVHPAGVDLSDDNLAAKYQLHRAD